MTTNGKFVIGAIVGLTIYVILDTSLPDGKLKLALEVVMFMGAMGYALFLGRQEYQARVHRDATNKPTEVAKSTHHEPLSDKEIKYLRKRMWQKMAAVVFAFLLVFSIYLVTTHFFLPLLLGQPGIYLFWILSGSILVGAVYLFGKRLGKQQQDIRQGMKLVIVGNLSRWERYPYNENDYVIYVEEIPIRVKPGLFEMFAKGDALEVHVFEPWKNMLLHFHKIEKDQ
ncbi:MAG: hypothetical protein JNN04_17495 [Cyclobacteriaceae bacterium]|nr:hypothetical protein [Cyclobacteriaceae bacterium]